MRVTENFYGFNNLGENFDADELSEVLERESARYSRKLAEEEEARIR